jgi:hypothetical protein
MVYRFMAKEKLPDKQAELCIRWNLLMCKYAWKFRHFPRSDVGYHIYHGTSVEIAAYVLRYICDHGLGHQDHEHRMDVKPKSQLV